MAPEIATIALQVVCLVGGFGLGWWVRDRVVKAKLAPVVAELHAVGEVLADIERRNRTGLTLLRDYEEAERIAVRLGLPPKVH